MSHEWKWQEEFTERLVAALKAFPDMQREDFRSLFLTRVGEKLELPGPFPAKHSQDPIQALYLIVDECREYKDKAAAVRALSAAMRALKPTAEACAELDECAGLLVWQEDVDAWHDGRTVLEIGQFAEVLEAISRMSTRYPLERIYQAVELAARPPEANPVNRNSNEDLATAVRRLSQMRLGSSADCPLILRFLATLTDALDPADARLLRPVVESIARDRGVSSANLGKGAGQSSSQEMRKKDIRVRVRVRDDLPPSDPPRYLLYARVFNVGGKARTRWEKCHRSCEGHDIDEAEAEFPNLITRLSGSVGNDDVRVQFYLPFDLLAHPVDVWSFDSTGFAVGRRFPVVVRLLDREWKYRWYNSWWIKRWNALNEHAAGWPIADWISWLHDGESNIPTHAKQDSRTFDATRVDDINRCLDTDRNPIASGLGLTFAFDPGSPGCRNIVERAIREGVPLLIWRRDGREASDLEGLLRTVSFDRLADGMRRWRYAMNGNGDDLSGADRGFVLMLDDPNDAPSRHQFVKP
jgi:hypothetical protein